MTRTGGIAVLSAFGLIGIGALALRPDSAPVAATADAAPAREFWATYRDATLRRTAGDPAGAAAAYERALRLRPDHEDSLYYLGNCRLEQRRFAEALEAYRRLVAVNPEGSSRGYMQWGLVHASLEPGAPRDLAEAERLFTRALEVDSDSGALLGLAEIALLRGDRERARGLLERADAENPMSVAAPFLLGYLASRRGAWDDARRLFERAIERGELKKPGVVWTEEGDVKADPALRWRALARQSVFGAHWLRLRTLAGQSDSALAAMKREYSLLEAAIDEVRR